MNPVIKILILSTLSFGVAITLTPVWLRILTRFKLGKQIRTEGVPIFAMFHNKKAGTPTMGGLLVWLTALILIVFFWLANKYAGGSFLAKLDFLSRRQTLLPLG